MARKQQEIPGFEWKRPDTWAKENPAIEEVAVAYSKVRDERAALSKKEKLALFKLVATLTAQNVEVYEYLDENGEVCKARQKHHEVTAEVVKTGDAVEDVGEGVEEAGPSEGILEDAAKTQSDANVAETDDGDVTVPDKAVPKATRKGKGKGKAKKS